MPTTVDMRNTKIKRFYERITIDEITYSRNKDDIFLKSICRLIFENELIIYTLYNNELHYGADKLYSEIVLVDKMSPSEIKKYTINCVVPEFLQKEDQVHMIKQLKVKVIEQISKQIVNTDNFYVDEDLNNNTITISIYAYKPDDVFKRELLTEKKKFIRKKRSHTNLL